MKFTNILTMLWSEPWLILPATHKKLCDVVEAHLAGAAHGENGIAGLFSGDEEEYGPEIKAQREAQSRAKAAKTRAKTKYPTLDALVESWLRS